MFPPVKVSRSRWLETSRPKVVAKAFSASGVEERACREDRDLPGRDERRPHHVDVVAGLPLQTFGERFRQREPPPDARRCHLIMARQPGVKFVAIRWRAPMAERFTRGRGQFEPGLPRCRVLGT